MRMMGISILALALITGLSACSSPTDEQNVAKVEAPGIAATPAEAPRANAVAEAVQPPANREPVVKREPVAPPVARATEVPAGTAINVVMIDSISTGKNQAGDEFMASLSEPLVVNGKTVADRGTKVRGRIVDAEGAGRVKGVASMRIVLTSILDGEKAIPIVTEPLVSEAEATKGRDAGVVAGAAGVGAAIGAIAGGKKGAGIGTIIGAGSGTGAVLATKGKEVEFGSESKLKFTLQRAASLPTITRKST